VRYNLFEDSSLTPRTIDTLLTFFPMASNMKSYSFRIDPELKRQAEEILAEHGISHSEIIRLFLERVVQHKGVSFLAEGR
jgi:hypothetical protein